MDSSITVVFSERSDLTDTKKHDLRAEICFSRASAAFQTNALALTNSDASLDLIVRFLYEHAEVHSRILITVYSLVASSLSYRRERIGEAVFFFNYLSDRFEIVFNAVLCEPKPPSKSLIVRGFFAPPVITSIERPAKTVGHGLTPLFFSAHFALSLFV